MQTGVPRQSASADRLPPMPEMLQRPPANPVFQQPMAQAQPASPRVTATMPAATASQPTVPSQTSWQPIRIPSPEELGILVTTITAPTPDNTPRQFTLAEVIPWLDQQGVRQFHRNLQADGIEFSCHLDPTAPVITARGKTEAEALEKLVLEVKRVRSAR